MCLKLYQYDCMLIIRENCWDGYFIFGLRYGVIWTFSLDGKNS
jgi:hypothetical protein